jgi:hypothetical protein
MCSAADFSEAPQPTISVFKHPAPPHRATPPHPPGALFTLFDGKLFCASGPAGASKLDALASLDLSALVPSYAFSDRMRAEAAGLLQGLELRAEKQAAGLELSAQPDALAANFESLLRVRAAFGCVRGVGGA